MAQTDIMRELVSRRLSSDGWTTIRKLEKVFCKEYNTKQIRQQTKRLCAYKFLEVRNKDKKTKEFRIKKHYLVGV